MTRNLNYVPWMTVLGVAGAGIGYLIGGASGQQAVVPALYGLCIGSAAGIVVRIVVRARTMRDQRDRDRESPRDSSPPGGSA